MRWRVPGHVGEELRRDPVRVRRQGRLLLSHGLRSLKSAHRCLALALVFVVVVCPFDIDAEADPTDDSLLFTRGNAVFEVAADGVTDEEPRALLHVPSSLVQGMRSADDGSAVLLDVNGRSAWSDLSMATVGEIRFLPCRGPAVISADGNRVACATRDGKETAVFQMRPTKAFFALNVRPRQLRFADAEGQSLFTVTGSGIFRFSVSGDIPPQRVALHKPGAEWVVSGQGTRVVASLRDNDTGEYGLFSFRPDGVAALRKLMVAAIPVALSSDGEWIAAQSDDRACLIRAMGGQYKCWNQYVAVAPSSTGGDILLRRRDAKGRSDYAAAEVEGARSAPPRTVLTDVVGAATWVKRTSLTPP